MSRTIDERVVEMRFDNKQFESATSQTLGTIQKLKEALNFSSSANNLKDLNKSVNDIKLDGIAAGVEALEKRFSVLGIVGMRVIQNLTDSVMNTLGKGIQFVNNAIISGGVKRAMNIENAHFQLQSLLKDEERVQAVMDSANRSVDGTAYSFDVAAKAASQFTASGITEIPKLDTALRALAGTTATYNADYSRMAMIFTQVAGKGRLMGDEMMQLNNVGLNAAATMKEFFNGINNGSIEASESVTAAVKNVTKGAIVTEGEIRDMASKSKISFDMFAESMNYAFGDSAAKANETFTGALSNIKAAFARIGAGFVSPLIEQNSEIVKLFNAVRVQVNAVKKALVFDESIGNVHALSKQFTDAVLSMAKSATEFVNNMDLTKPLQAFYYGVKSTTNVLGFLFDVLKPIGTAFKDVFLTFSGDDVVNLARNFEKLTEKLKLSDKASENLQDAFKGVFNVGKLLLELCFQLVKAIIPINNPAKGLGETMLSLAGSMGRSLTSFTEWIRSSEKVAGVFSAISTASQFAVNAIGGLISAITKFISSAAESEFVSELFETMITLMGKAGEISLVVFKVVIDKVKELKDLAADIVSSKFESFVEGATEALSGFGKTIGDLKIEKISDIFKIMLDSITGLRDLIKNSEGLNSFLTNVQDYFKRLRDAVGIDEVADKLNTVRSVFDDFIAWTKNLLSPLGEGVNLGSVLSTITGVGIMYEISKMAKAFKDMTKPIDAITGLLGQVKTTLVAYQKELNAKSILMIAGAIGVLTVALIGLSFVEPDRLLSASMALAGLAAVLLTGMTALMNAAKQSKTTADVLNTAAKYFGTAFNNFAKAVKWKMIASALKSFGTAIATISASLIALAVMYGQDKESLEAASGIVLTIAGILSAMMVVFAGLGEILDRGASNMAKAATGIVLLSASVAITVGALKTLFNLEFPEDWKQRMALLSEIFVGLGALSVLMGLAARLGGGGDQISATAILAAAASMTLVVMALQKLFALELPDDMGAKLALLTGAMIGMAAVAAALGIAGTKAGGALAMSASVLAMCVLIGAITVSLMVLKDIPFLDLLSGAASLGLVLLAVAAALAGAGKITEKSNYKSVFAMAANIGVITASLGVLSMIEWTALAKAVAALDLVLLALAHTFKQVGEITNGESYLVVVAMVAQVLAISYSLTVLASQPWDSLLAAAASMSIVLIAMGKVYEQMGDMGDVNLTKIALYLAATLALVPVGIALYTLASQPWEGMLAAGTAIALVLTAFIGVFAIASMASPNIEAIGTFLLATVALLPVALALKELANEPWEGLLVAASAISAVILAMSAVLLICSGIGAVAPAAIFGIALLDALLIDIIAVFAILGKLSKMEGFMEAIRGGYGFLGEMADAIGAFFGGIVKSAINTAAEALPNLGTQLSNFMTEASPFFSGISNVNEGAMAGIKNLAQAVLTITQANILNGLTSWFTGGTSIVKFGEELSQFGPYFSKYCDSIANVNGAAVQASASAAQVMADLASKLPPSGGLVQKILGEKKLSEFGKELVLFGPYLSLYAASVANVNPQAVKASADAAQIMSDMNTTLPASGGLVQKILGEKKLSEFGKELALFGPQLALYAASVAGVKGDVVQASANAAMAMSELANKLPNSGGLIAFFTGDNDISAFGKKLSSFGESFSAYYRSVSGINTSTLNAVSTEFERLINLASGVSSVDTSGMSRFSMDLANLGLSGIDQFIQAFNKSDEKVTTAVLGLVTTMVNALTKNVDKFSKAGEASLKAYTDEFKKSSVQTTMREIGTWVVKSLASGITNNVSMLATAGRLAGSAVENAIRNTLDIHSYSPKFGEIGKWTGKSMERGMTESSKDLIATAREIGSSLVTAVKDPIYEAYKDDDAFGDMASNMISSMSQYGTVVTNSTTNMFDNVASAVNSGNEEIDKAEKSGNNRRRVNSADTEKIQNERLISESTYWSQLLETKRQGAESEKYMEMSLADFQKEVLSNTVDILKEYRDQLESTANSIMGSFSLFDEVTRKEAKSKEEITENLASQIRVIEEYSRTLESLNERLGDSKLGEYIRTLSVDSLDQLEVLNSMTDEELTRYSELYDTKMAAATEAAALQLVGLRDETESKLSEVFGTMNAQVNLYDFASVFDGSLQSIDGYIANLNTKFSEFNVGAQTLGAEFPQNLTAGVEGGMGDFVGNVGSAINTALQTIGSEQATSASETGKEIGTNLETGVGTGMLESTAAQESAKTLMDNITNALAAAGEIHSPSLRTNREIGVPLVEGIGVALSETTEPLTTGANTLAGTLINAITSSVSEKFSEVTGNMKELATKMVEGIKNNLPQSDIQNNGVKVVEWIISGIKSKDGDLLTKVKNTCEDTVKKFTTSLKDSDFKPNGVNIITWIMQGMESMFNPLEGIIQTICNNIIEWIESKLDKDRLYNAGQSVIQAIIDGINSLSDILITSCETISSSIISKLSGTLTYNAGFAIGSNFSKGLAEGIASRKSSDGDDDEFEDPVDAAEDLASEIESELEYDLQINSPSKLTMRMGQYLVEGLAIGIRNGKKVVSESVKGITDETVSDFSNAIKAAYKIIEETDVDANPTITPVVNLSEVKRGAQEVSRILAGTYNLSTRNQVMSAAATFQAAKRMTEDSKIQNESKTPVEQNFEFVQNNYSPKALSRSDIYRQTSNQFTAFKNAVAEA